MKASMIVRISIARPLEIMYHAIDFRRLQYDNVNVTVQDDACDC